MLQVDVASGVVGGAIAESNRRNKVIVASATVRDRSSNAVGFGGARHLDSKLPYPTIANDSSSSQVTDSSSSPVRAKVLAANKAVCKFVRILAG